MLLIVDPTVDARCIATTGGTRLFYSALFPAILCAIAYFD
jgi:hypothetical protein